MADSPGSGALLVAADQVEVVATAYVDALYDLLRRGGCPVPTAVDLVRATLLDLVDRAAAEPKRVDDAVAAAFAAERVEAARHRARRRPAANGSAGPVEKALRRLPADVSAAVLLRDAYGLSGEATATALGVDADDAARAVADGRLAVFAAMSGRPAADLAGHRPTPLADIGLLGRYVDGSVPPARLVAVRRHVATCPDCGDVVTAQERARRTLAALPLETPTEADRARILEPVLAKAAALLPPSVDLVAFAGGDTEPSPSVRALLVVWVLVIAALVGLVAGVLAAR